MTNIKRTSMPALALAACIASTFACSNSGKGDGNPQAATTVSSGTLGADVTKFSRIVITAKDQWLDLKGYVVGDSSHASLQNLVDISKPGFMNMNEGLYDVVLEGKVVGIDGKSSPAALRISGVKVTNGLDTQIREVDLKPYITLDGKVLLSGESSHAGIAVSIPGTSLKATTAADGSYSIANVPFGLHNIEFAAAGYNSGFIQAKEYRGDEHLPSISLSKESVRLDAGVYYLGSPVTPSSSQKIVLHLSAPSSMTSFRYGNSENLSDRPWSKLQSSFETDLPAGEHPEIFVQFSLDERQLSPVFSSIIPLEN